GSMFGNEVGALGLRVADQGPDLEHAVLDRNAVEPGNCVDADREVRARQPHIEGRDERLAAREHACLDAVTAEQLDGMIERASSRIGECGRLHFPPRRAPFHRRKGLPASSGIGRRAASREMPHRPRSERETLSFAGVTRRSGSSRSPSAPGAGAPAAASLPANRKPTIPHEATAYCRSRSSTIRGVPGYVGALISSAEMIRPKISMVSARASPGLSASWRLLADSTFSNLSSRSTVTPSIGRVPELRTDRLMLTTNIWPTPSLNTDWTLARQGST